jgi:hypothetical protein
MKNPLNLGARWMREVTFASRPPYLRERKRKPIEQKAGLAPESFWTIWWRETFFTSAGIRTPGPSNTYPSRYTDCLPIASFLQNSLPICMTFCSWSRSQRTCNTREKYRCQRCRMSAIKTAPLVNAMACQLGVFTLPRHGLSTLGHHFNKCTHLTVTFILLPR